MADADIRIHIIGVGSDGLAGLTSQARELAASRRRVLGSEQALAALPELRAERVRLGFRSWLRSCGCSKLNMARNAWCWSPAAIRSSTASPATCATGSARIASRWCRTSAACSSPSPASRKRWEEAYLTNLATHPLASVLDRIRTAETVGLFTSESETAARIARELLDRGLDYFAPTSARTWERRTNASRRGSWPIFARWSSRRSTS